MLTTDQVERLCRRVRFFQGVYSVDNLPYSHRIPGTFIINTDPVGDPGEHWVVIHVRAPGKVDYFDPFGFPPLLEGLQQFMGRFQHQRYSARSMQDVNSTLCGDFCICFVKCVARGYDLPMFISRFQNIALGGSEMNKRKLHCLRELSH